MGDTVSFPKKTYSTDITGSSGSDSGELNSDLNHSVLIKQLVRFTKLVCLTV